MLCILSNHGFTQENSLVTVVTAEKSAAIERLQLTGTLTSARQAALSPRVSGLIRAVNVDAGDTVDVGDTVVELDDTLATLELERNQAAIAEQQVQLAEARRLFNEAQQLLEERTLAPTQAHAAEARVKSAEAALQRLQVEQQRLAELVERHIVPAPFAAMVASKLVEVGEWVETGTAMLELVETDHLRLDVQVPQERYTSVNTGMPVTIQADASLPQNEIKAKVSARVASQDTSGRTFLVRIELDNPDDQLTPGMSARATFELTSNTEALLVPRDAIVRTPDGGTWVWQILTDANGDTRVNQRQVKLGRTLSDNIEIRAGLQAGDSVVLRGNESLQQDQRVIIVD